MCVEFCTLLGISNTWVVFIIKNPQKNEMVKINVIPVEIYSMRLILVQNGRIRGRTL